MRTALVILALLLATSAHAADAPTVVAKASKTDVTVGEPFTVEVKASGPPGTTFTFPPEAAQESFELRTPPPPPASSGKPAPAPPADMHTYTASVFALGDAQVPEIPVRYRLPDGTTGEVKTAPIALHVVSLLPKAKDEQKLADVAAPMKVGIGRPFWIGLAVLLALVAALVWWIVTRRRVVAPFMAPAVPAVPADVEARSSLDQLVASGRLARAEYRPFYIELTAIAKRYLERRLDAPIVEMTTAEMLGHLRSTPHGVDMAPTMRDLSGAADQIKFARGRGLTEEAERHLAATRGMIDTLETRMRPAAATAAAPEGGQAA